MGIQHLLKTANYSEDVCVVDDTLLKQIQNDLLEMINDISTILDELDIEWCLSGGSVLGAVRHHGFIPWDDDIDIFMKREEFEKLRDCFSSKFGEKYDLLVPGDDNYIFNMPQIHKKGTRMVPIQSPEISNGGLFVDIFILENTYNNLFLRSIHGAVCTLLLFVDSSMRMKKCKNNILKYTNNDKQISKEVNKRAFFSPLFSFFTLEKWLKISDAYFSKIKNPTDYLVCPSGAKHFFGEIYNRSLFDEMKQESFESSILKIPCQAEVYLEQRYGSDYMVVPNKNERERHIYASIDLGGNNR